MRGVLADDRNEKNNSLLAIAVLNLEAHAIAQLELPLGLSDEGRRRGTNTGVARSRADRAHRRDPQTLRRRTGGLWIRSVGWPLRG